MNTTIAKATDAAQFLALVPQLIRCRPVRSLVLVPLDRGRSLGALRVDLGPDDPDSAERTASTLIGMMCRVRDADAVIAAVYTDAPAAPELPYRALADALERRADASGLRLLDVLTVAADGWGSHLDGERRVRPLAEIETDAVEGDQTAGAEPPRVSDDDLRAVREARAALARALEVVADVEAPATDGGGPVTAETLQAACALADLPLLYESALAWDAEALHPVQAALLAWCLGRPALRDIAIVQWSADLALGEQAEHAQERWEKGEEYPVDLAERLWGEGPRPDPERLDRALALVRRVAALTPDQAGPLAVCAWLSWALGRSTHADQYARRAHDVDPRHGLADIVRSFVAAAHLPDWAFQRPE